MHQKKENSVLLIGTNIETSYLITQILSEIGAVQITQAFSAKEALKKILTEHFSLVILEASLDDLDALELVALITQQKISESIAIVMLFELKHEINDIQKAYQAGVSDTLIVPFESNVFTQKIRQILTYNQARSTIDSIKKQYCSVLNTIQNPLLMVNDQGKIQWVNQSCCQFLKVNVADILFSSIEQWIRQGEAKPVEANFYEKILHRLAEDGTYQVQNMLLQPKQDLPVVSVILNCSRIKSDVEDLVVIVIQPLVADLSLAIGQRDQLRGLVPMQQQTEVELRLKHMIARSKRTGSTLALFKLDLDHFKRINDNYGFKVGDRLLIAVLDRMQECLREIDIVVYFGSDEYVVVTDDLTMGKVDAIKIAGKLLREVSQPYSINNQKLVVESSIGIALCSSGDFDAATLLKHADLALYLAKSAGRNKYRIFIPHVTENLQQDNDIEQYMQYAIDNDSLQVHYQPQIGLSKQQLVGLEALARWYPPQNDRQPISPSIFVPIAEQTQLIHNIGLHVLLQVCKQLRAWQQRDAKTVIKVAINISEKQLLLPSLVQMMAMITEEFSVNRQSLVLEFADLGTLSPTSRLIDTLWELHDLGFLIALNDFSQGHFSLIYLQELPFHYIKINPQLTQAAPLDKTQATFLAAMLTTANAFQLRSIAVGVETVEQLLPLVNCGCEYVQGNFFSLPLTAQDIESKVFKSDAPFLRQFEDFDKLKQSLDYV